nr:glyceraldehyde-3-phosphate dehydrogenase B, chloroplastic [Ipomoea batatas]
MGSLLRLCPAETLSSFPGLKWGLTLSLRELVCSLMVQVRESTSKREPRRLLSLHRLKVLIFQLMFLVSMNKIMTTINCLAPFVKVMDEELGIVKGTMTTTHSYTGDQRLLDASHRDLRRARAAALNIVPTSTGAAKAVSLVLPKLKGKLNGIALRVPTPNVSVVDLVVNVEKKGLTAEDVNAAFRKAADGPLKGILDVCDAPLVSVDFRCTDVSSTIDASLTMVMGDDMVKVVAWYDNEWGYSQRVVDLAHLVANKWPGVAAAGSGDPLEDFCKTNPADEECKVYEA